ncbi:hypothetical protein SEUCBS139899_004559 [Sporothrix eucalyptigena]
MDGFGNLLHMHEVVEADDVPAIRELICIEPNLVKFNWDGEVLCPPMVLAARLGRHAILDVLMKHRATLPSEMRVIPEYGADDDYLRWGTPLTEACAWGRLNTVRLLLQGMPDTDINEVALDGLTPLLAAANFQIGPPEARVELIRFLIKRGADIHAVRQAFLSYYETLEKRYDESCETSPFVWRPRPGGNGNALALALRSDSTHPGVVAVLVEAGVSVYQSYSDGITAIDKTDGQDVGRYDHCYYDRAYISPIAAGAKHHNVDGVKALLALFPDDHNRLLATTDAVLVPQPLTPLRDPDDEVPVLLPLHAAAMGPSRASLPWALNDCKDYCKAAVDMVRLLTADAAICAATINARYRRYYTPLHLATGFHRMPLMLALVERGADIEALPRQNGPGLILSLFSPRGKDAQLDAQNAATRVALINEADANGNTPLHFAMAYRMHRSTAALLALGARANAANHAGQVPSAPPPGEKPSF